ncbi:hypothetical protein ABZ499_27510 [Streptomyces sp. NPDC019990]|uniref:hypothetical protein n=1 Tax=Streptomyces sp. NPDC019990 TaxID=3154693 RepID=UPI0033E1F3C5
MSDRITLDPALDPWERQPGETPKKYGHFLTFRDQGVARTLSGVAEALNFTHRSAQVIATRFRWQERAAAWDAHLSRQYAAQMEEERRRAATEDVKIMRIMTGMIGQALPHVQQLAPDMTLAEFTKFVDTTMKWRRTLLGDPTATIAVTGPGGDPLSVQIEEFAAMPPEQRRVRLAELAATVARRVQATDDSDDEDDEETYPLDDDEDDGEEDEPGPAGDEPSGEE